MDLATHQRDLRRLLVGDPPSGNDAYAARVSGTEQLDLLRDIGASWRHYTLSRTCPFTWHAAGAQGQREALVAHFGRLTGLSPYLPARALRFLDLAAAEGSPLVAAVARFERSV